ncbi:MAG: DJ-1/PfpI family protein [Anaerolineae bacterium]|nr:DJ-1/PfpI family protein [Anaerolineae bacterium]
MSARIRNEKKAKTKSFILIGDGFDEFEVVYLIHKFRQAGLSIKSVSLFNKLVYSRQGVGIKADCALAERPFDNVAEDCLLILPTGGRNGEALRQDARVRPLLQLVRERHGRVAVTDGKSNLAHDIGQVFTSSPSLIQPGEQPLELFVAALTGHAMFTS